MALRKAVIATMLATCLAGGAEACVVVAPRGTHDVELRVVDTPRYEGLTCRFRAEVVRVLRAPRGTRPPAGGIEVAVSCYNTRVSPPCPMMRAGELRPGRVFRGLLNRAPGSRGFLAAGMTPL